MWVAAGKYIETAVAAAEDGSNTKRYKIATPLKRVRSWVASLGLGSSTSGSSIVG
jgi:hypothetical protein